MAFKTSKEATNVEVVKKKVVSDFVQFSDNTILWSASLILLKHLQQPEQRQKLKGKRVLELGSGLGHLGYGLSKLGCHVTCTEQPSELAALQASLEQQKLVKKPPLQAGLELLGHSDTGSSTAGSSPGDCAGESGSVQAVSLEWGEEGYLNSPLSTHSAGTFDFIICSELYYIERAFPLLLWTMRKFSHPGTCVWSIFLDRPFSFYFFSLLSDEKCWDVQVVDDFDDLNIDPEVQVHMHKFHFIA